MSHNKQILNHLIQYKRIDAITALKKYGCFRLAARISDLKDEGHIFNPTKMVKHQGKRFGVYTLKSLA